MWWESQSLLPFRPCSSINVSGPTGCGKSFWTFKLLKNIKGMFSDEPPNRILYCYSVYQPLFDEMEQEIENISFNEGLPSQEQIDDMASTECHNLLVVDDLVHAFMKCTDMELLLTQGCHHKRFSVIIISQNLFQPGRSARTIALNTWYQVIFKNLRDVSQINTFGRQMFPGNPGVLQESYNHATSVSHGYLVIDNSPNSDPKYRLRTRIFPNEDPIVYTPRV